MTRATNITTTDAVPIDRVSAGTEFIVHATGDFNSGNLQVQYNRGDGTYQTFASGTLTAAGETVFTTGTEDMQIVASVADTDVWVIVEELRFRSVR